MPNEVGKDVGQVELRFAVGLGKMLSLYTAGHDLDRFCASGEAMGLYRMQDGPR